MIIECDNAQRQEIVAYIGSNYSKCLYLFIDMMRYGCKSDLTQVWKQTGEEGIVAVMLAYHSALHIYSQCNNFDADELSQFILTLQPSMVCADAESIKKLHENKLLKDYQMEIGHVGQMLKSSEKNDSTVITRATDGDVEDIATLLYEDDDIGGSYDYDDLLNQIKERLSDGFVRSYVIRKDGHVIAHVGTGAELPQLCTISYVITDPMHRGHGCASQLLNAACSELLVENKEIYSVYYPDASRMLHHKMGFVDVGEIGKLFKNKH